MWVNRVSELTQVNESVLGWWALNIQAAVPINIFDNNPGFFLVVLLNEASD